MLKLTERPFERLRENLYEAEIANGLRVFILPKPEFHQTYATLTTKYGSLDSEFRDPETNQWVKVPDGIAHFLEHKMFEKEDGDVFNKFARLGAQANAFTTFDSTTYLFSATSHVEENLEVLLDFVQTPYFTDQNVEKEKGIIAQEIKMYEDNPNWRAYFGLLKGFYGDHPAATDIAGTVESIGQITKTDLYLCYRTFYHPANMVLFVVGPVDPERILALVEKNQAGKMFSDKRVKERYYPPMPVHPVFEEIKSRLVVSQPRILFGYKDLNIPADPILRSRQEIAIEIGLDAMLGRSSAFFHSLIDAGLTDQGFSAEYELSERYGHTMIGGNSKDPLGLSKRVQVELQVKVRMGITEADFERSKRKAIGRFVSLLDSPQGLAHVFTTQKLRDIDILDTIEMLEKLDSESVHDILLEHLKFDQFSASLVEGIEGDQSDTDESAH